MAPMRFCILAAFLCGVTPVDGEPKKIDIKKDRDSLEGTWSLESHLIAGKDVKAFPMTITVSGNRFHIKSRLELVQSGELKVDPTQKPKAIDLTVTSGVDKGKTATSIYELVGDRLRICSNPEGKERPTKFESPEGSKQVLGEFKRLSRGADDPDAKALQGSWRVIQMEDQGRKMPLNKEKPIVLTFSGNAIAMQVQGKAAFEGTFDLLPSFAPRQIDWIVKNDLTPGIYKLEKDRLTICITSVQVLGSNNRKRAMEFATAEDSRTTMFVLEKDK